MHTAREKDKILKRVKRIRGQVDGIERALMDERHSCSSVLQTIAACRGAINGLMAEVLEEHIRDHILDPAANPSSTQSSAAEDVIDLINSYLR